MSRQIDAPRTLTSLPGTRRSVSFSIPNLSPILEQSDSQDRWVTRSNLSPFLEVAIEREMASARRNVSDQVMGDRGPPICSTRYGGDDTSVANPLPPQPLSMNQVRSSFDPLQQDIMEDQNRNFPDRATSTRPLGYGTRHVSVGTDPIMYRPPQEFNDETRVIPPFGQETFIQSVTTVDDRSVISEMMARQPPCQSDHYEHIFLFLTSLFPLFNLKLLPDHLLLKYLLPKVQGSFARLLLNMVSMKGTFNLLCFKAREIYFGDRAAIDLANKYFFQNFQTSRQSAENFIEFSQAVYFLLLIPMPESKAVYIIMENLLPDVLVALAGRPWPTTFQGLFQMVQVLNEKSVILEQRMQAALRSQVFGSQSMIPPFPDQNVTPSTYPRPCVSQTTMSHNLTYPMSNVSQYPLSPNMSSPTSCPRNVHNDTGIIPPVLPVPPSQLRPDVLQPPVFHPPAPFTPQQSPPNQQFPRTNTSSRNLGFSASRPGCFTCGDPSHMQRACPRRSNATVNQLPMRPNCSYCGKLGHYISHCFLRQRQQGSGNE